MRQVLEHLPIHACTLTLLAVLGGCPRFVVPGSAAPDASGPNAAGEGCASNSDCRSLVCQDGVCCTAACPETEVCNAAGALGQCTPRQLGQACSAAAQCPSGTCAHGVCCDQPCGNGMACELPDSLGHCITRRLGRPCAQDTQCASGFCADQVCCNQACTDTCSSCALHGSAPGMCQQVPDGTDPEGDCAATACSACFGGRCERASPGTDPNLSCGPGLVCSDKPSNCGKPGGAPCETDDECAEGSCLHATCLRLEGVAVSPDTQPTAEPLLWDVLGLAASPSGHLASLLVEYVNTNVGANLHWSVVFGRRGEGGWNLERLPVSPPARPDFGAVAMVETGVYGILASHNNVGCGAIQPNVWEFWTDATGTVVGPRLVEGFTCADLSNMTWLAAGLARSQDAYVALARSNGTLRLRRKAANGDASFLALPVADTANVEGAVLVLPTGAPLVLDVQTGTQQVRARWVTGDGTLSTALLEPLAGCSVYRRLEVLAVTGAESQVVYSVALRCTSPAGLAFPALARLTWDGAQVRWDGAAVAVRVDSLQPEPEFLRFSPVWFANGDVGVLAQNNWSLQLVWPTGSGVFAARDIWTGSPNHYGMGILAGAAISQGNTLHALLSRGMMKLDSGTAEAWDGTQVVHLALHP